VCIEQCVCVSIEEYVCVCIEECVCVYIEECMCVCIKESVCVYKEECVCVCIEECVCLLCESVIFSHLCVPQQIFLTCVYLSIHKCVSFVSWSLLLVSFDVCRSLLMSYRV